LDVSQINKRDKRANNYIQEQLIKCPHQESHNCPWTGHVADVEEHCSNGCQSSLVKCPFHAIGCNVRVPRKELEHHINDNVSQHLTLAMLKMGNMSDEISQLKSTLANVQSQQIDALSKRVDQINSDILPIRNTTMALSGYLVITIPRHEFITKQFNESIDSQPFEYAGYRWKVRVFPRGDRQDKQDYPSFYLWSEHNYEQVPVDLETRYTLSFENKNHQFDVKHSGILGANFMFSKRIGNGWSMQKMNQEFTTEYISNAQHGFIHDEDDCLHIRACILDVKPRKRMY